MLLWHRERWRQGGVVGPTPGRASSYVSRFPSFHVAPFQVFHSDTGTISQVIYLLKSMSGHPRELRMGHVEAKQGAKALTGPGGREHGVPSPSVTPNLGSHCSGQCSSADNTDPSLPAGPPVAVTHHTHSTLWPPELQAAPSAGCHCLTSLPKTHGQH